MTRGSRIVAIGGEADQEGIAPDAATMESQPDEASDEAYVDDWEGEAAPRFRGWIAPVLAILAVAAWTAFLGWTRQDLLAGGPSPAQWADLASAWSGPVLLIGVAWLLAMRNSRREAARFGDAARLLATESERLEQRLLATNRELSLAREFIAAQGRDLEALGRVAVERLSQNAERLQSL
ncbi:MAG: hypothetical protein RIQ46_1009, partial [Pseudomonadota bacterium]